MRIKATHRSAPSAFWNRINLANVSDSRYSWLHSDFQWIAMRSRLSFKVGILQDFSLLWIWRQIRRSIGRISTPSVNRKVRTEISSLRNFHDFFCYDMLSAKITSLGSRHSIQTDKLIFTFVRFWWQRWLNFIRLVISSRIAIYLPYATWWCNFCLLIDYHESIYRLDIFRRSRRYHKIQPWNRRHQQARQTLHNGACA